MHAFRRNGFGAEQNMVSTFIRRHLLEASVAVAPTLLPIVTDIKHIFPSSRINISSGIVIAWRHAPLPDPPPHAPMLMGPDPVPPPTGPGPIHQIVMHGDYVNMQLMPRPAAPLPVVVSRRPRAKQKAKAKPKAKVRRRPRVAVRVLVPPAVASSSSSSAPAIAPP